MKRTNSETTYCSEAEKILTHYDDQNSECNLRRSKRLSQKPHFLEETICWENIRFTKQYAKRKKKLTPKGSSQFLAEKIEDCSVNGIIKLKEPPISHGISKNSIDLIAELETPIYYQELPQDQKLYPQNLIRTVESDFPIDLRTNSKNLNIINKDALLPFKNAKDNEVEHGSVKMDYHNPNEKETKLKNMEELNMAKSDIVWEICDNSEPLIQTKYAAVNKVEPTSNSNTKKRHSPSNLAPTVKSSKKMRTDLMKNISSKPPRRINSRKKQNFSEEVNMNILIHDRELRRGGDSNENTFNNKQPIDSLKISSNTTSFLPTTSKILPSEVHGRNTVTVSNPMAISKLAPPNNSAFALDIINNNPLIPTNAEVSNLNMQVNSKQNTTEKLKKINIGTNRGKRIQNDKKTSKKLKRSKSNCAKDEQIGKLAKADEEVKYGQIPRITTIPLLPATRDSLLPKVYPPHFTGQLPAPEMEKIATNDPKDTLNYIEAELKVHCDRGLNYWLTPELTQPLLDEEVLSSSTPSMSDSLKGIFEADSFREVLQIEKIVYRLGEKHVKVLAMILDVRVEILNDILKQIVELNDNILKRVSNMMKTAPSAVCAVDTQNSSERVEPCEMAISPMSSSSSVELLESPKAVQSSRIFQSQRNTHSS